MTKKDYERAAQVVQEWMACRATVEARAVQTAFVRFFQEDGNPRFDEARFRAACVPGANVKALKPTNRKSIRYLSSL